MPSIGNSREVCLQINFYLTFYRFLFVVNMEMAILGFRRFLLITPQNN
jgi:hypothetical protein